MPPVLSVDGLSLRYGPRILFDDLSFSLQAGEWLGIHGPNGCGKSSLLDLIDGRGRTRSKIQFRGLNVGRWSAKKRFRAGIRRLTQFLPFEPSYTVNDYLRLGGGLEARDLFQLPGPKPVERLGPGEARLLGIAMMLGPGAHLLLLDEPLAGLEGPDQEQVLGGLSRLRSKVAALWVEHDLERLEPSTDRCLGPWGEPKPHQGWAPSRNPTQTLQLERMTWEGGTLESVELSPSKSLSTEVAEVMVGLRPGHSVLSHNGCVLPKTPQARRHWGLSFMLDPPRLWPELTASEHLLACPWPEQALEIWSELLGPTHPRTTPAALMSGGEQRILGWSLALAGPVRALLVDPRARGGLAPEILGRVDRRLAQIPVRIWVDGTP